MIALDGSALIAYLDPADAHHVRISVTLDDVAREPWVVSPLTLAEVMVQAASDDETLMEMSERIADLEPTVVDLEWLDSEPLARLRARTRLRMPDACVLRLAEQHGARIVTTDETLAARAREIGVGVVDLPE